MLALVVLAVAAAALLALPLLMVRVAFKIAISPAAIVGLLLRIAFGVVGLVFRVVFSVIGVLLGVLAFVLFLVVLPLLPLAIVGFVVWLIVRETRPRHSLEIA